MTKVKPNAYPAAVLSNGTITSVTADKPTLKPGSLAEKIWTDLKDKDLNLFSLPNQKVHMHCTMLPINDKELYLSSNTTAFLPALEELVGSKYHVELQEKYICIKHTDSVPDQKDATSSSVVVQTK